MTVTMRVFRRHMADEVASYDFGNGECLYIPHYKWEGCTGLQHCVFVENDRILIPRLYNLTNKDVCTYNNNNINRQCEWKQLGVISKCIRTNRGIMTRRDIALLLEPTSGNSCWDYITSDYHTDEGSLMRQTRQPGSPLKTIIYTDRGDRAESTPLDNNNNMFAYAHSVIGQNIYIFDETVSHCDRRMGYTQVQITNSVWSVEEEYWDEYVKFASRVMGDHIIAVSYIRRHFEKDPRVSSAGITYIYANLLDLRWPSEYVGQYPRIELNGRTYKSDHPTISCFCMVWPP